MLISGGCAGKMVSEVTTGFHSLEANSRFWCADENINIGSRISLNQQALFGYHSW